MSGPFQVGDIIAIANVAKKLYSYGWERRYSSCRNYTQFGQDVDALRYNLDILAAVIQGADAKLHDLTSSRTAALRWDPRSLGQIIGDCWNTIDECDRLLSDNSSFSVDPGPLKSIRWNLMVQDEVDALQFRIRQHAAKIQLALAPFEIDLLTSIQRSIHEMHADLQFSLQEVRRDVQKVLQLHGVVVPELQQGLERQEAQTSLLIVPTAIRDKLDHIYSKTTKSDSSLTDLADAFVTHFYESTYSFQPVSRIARDKVPPDKAYLNLMKCIWLIEKLKESEEFRNVPEESHWISYLAELEKVLSDECRRFENELATPSQPTLSDEYLRIWRKESRSSTVLIPKEAEVVLSTKVIQRTDDGEQQELKLQLLRYLDGTNGQEFTINMYGGNDDHTLVGSLDFDLRTAVLIPRYVVGNPGAGSQRLPEPPPQRGLWLNRGFRSVENDRPPSTLTLAQQPQGPYRVILGRGRRYETFNFKRLKAAMAFQHAITGYLVQESKSFTANVTFVFPNQGSRLPRYKAYVQVWYPMRKEADLAATAGLSSGGTTPTGRANSAPFASSPRSSMMTFNDHMRGGASPDFRNPFGQQIRDTRDPMRSGMDHRPNRQTSLSTISPTEPSRSPPGLGVFSIGRGSEMYTNPEDIVPPRVPSVAQDDSVSLAQQSQASSRRTSIFSTMRSRTQSSVTSLRTNRSSSSSGGGGGSSSTIVVDTGGGIVGTLHAPPPKPMIVILIDAPEFGGRAIVTLDLPTSEVRPDLCDCRRGDAQGRGCRDVCLEFSRQAAGGSRRSFLQARVLKPTTAEQSTDWDLSRLAYTRRNDDGVNGSPLENLNRVTISFDRASDRTMFAGDLFCGCANRGVAGLETDRQRRDCVKENHRGIVGQAKEFYLKEVRAFESAEASRTHVVNGPRPND